MKVLLHLLYAYPSLTTVLTNYSESVGQNNLITTLDPSGCFSSKSFRNAKVITDDINVPKQCSKVLLMYV